MYYVKPQGVENRLTQHDDSGRLQSKHLDELKTQLEGARSRIAVDLNVLKQARQMADCCDQTEKS